MSDPSDTEEPDFSGATPMEENFAQPSMEEATPMEAAPMEDIPMGEAPMEEVSVGSAPMEEAHTGEDFSAKNDKQPLVDRRKKAVLGVPIEVVISVGKARPLLSELVGLRRDSVLTLDSKIEDPVEIMVGDRVIARGELQEVDSETGQLCVRLTEVADLSQSL